MRLENFIGNNIQGQVVQANRQTFAAALFLPPSLPLIDSFSNKAIPDPPQL
jgi:hypothetical protein